MQNSKEGPRPYPYETHTVSMFGHYSFVDYHKESLHVSIGRDGWAPMVYALALRHLEYQASSSVARYMDIVNAKEILGALEDWQTRDSEMKKAWLTRLEEDARLFDGMELPGVRNSGAPEALPDFLFAMHPPHQGVILCCSKGYSDWFKLPENKAHAEALVSRYNWLQEQVAAEFVAAGFVVEGPLFKVDSFKALYYDEWDIYNF